MDPNWLALVCTIVGSGVSAFVGTKVALARIEERQKVLKEDVDDHEYRIRDLERDARPLDYPVRR
jgi:prefoldin subunit 5